MDTIRPVQKMIRVHDGEESRLFELPLELLVRDRETIDALHKFPEGEREQYALTALKIGVAALRHASGQLDGETIQRESARMLKELQQELQQHAKQVQERLDGELKNYFDPESGRFNERVQRLVKQDGELEMLLRRQIGGQDSELCKTLLAHFGAQSPLMKMLSPDQSQGLMAALRESLDGQLTSQRDRLLKEFSLDNSEGALARLVAELTKNHGQLTENLTDKIDEVVKEFSLNDDNSALSRLVKNVRAAEQTIRSEFSLDNDLSAFSRLRVMLEDTRGAINKNLTLDDEAAPLARLRRELFGILKEYSSTNQVFQEEVKVALGQLVARREEAARSTRHGADFEQAVCEFVLREAQAMGDTAEPIGNSVGLIKNCKVGDCLVQLGPDNPAAGAKIVVEAKEDVSVTLLKAREEIERGRDNRGAQQGLFVFSKKSAPAGVEPFARYGHDVIVVWDAEDPTTDVYLKAGLLTARALCIRAGKQSEAQAADFEAIDRAMLNIEKKSEGLDEINRSAESIKSASDKILNRVRITREDLERQLGTLREKMDDLKKTVDAAGE